jgi:phage tail-like protein
MESAMPTPKKARANVDPYRDYTLRVKWDGQLVAGIARVGPLKRIAEVVEYREGGGPGETHKSPGRTRYEPITLERGMTHDASFEAWAKLVAGTETPESRFRKEVRIEVYTAAGQLSLAYNVHRCWPSEYVALSSLEAGAECRLVQSLTLQHEGWERDVTVGTRFRGRRLSR